MNKFPLSFSLLLVSFLSLSATDYITNIAYDIPTQTFFFHDSYYEGQYYSRTYYISAYSQSSPKTNKIAESYFNYRSMGGDISSDHKFYSSTIENMINACYRAGISDIRFYIQGFDNDNYKNYPHDTEEDKFFQYYVDVSLPKINICEIALPESVRYRDTLLIKYSIQAVDEIYYTILRSTDEGSSWTTHSSGFLSILSARAKNGSITRIDTLIFNKNGERKSLFKLVVASRTERDTSISKPVSFFYPYSINGKEPTYRDDAGSTKTFAKAGDCQEYKITSELPVKRTNNNDGSFTLTYPACPMTCNLESLTYIVKFYNADYTLLSTQSIPCGQNATAPDTPSLSNLYFDKWSRDFTNVHSNMSVYAVYTMGGNYYYSCDIVRHTNSRYPALGFADNTSRAMMGDTIEFEVSVATPQISNLYFQTGNRKENGEWEWTSPTNNKIGTFDETDIAKNTVKTFTHTFPIAYDYGNEMAWRNAQACRFYISCAGETVYFDPFEFDVYYPLSIQNQIENEDLLFENSDGDFDYSGYNRYFPARYNDTIHIYQMSGSNGTCLQFDRTIHSDRPLTSGLDDEEYAYFICPGEKETINVSTEKYMLVFDDASPTHTFDFSEYGFSYKPNAYYAEVVNCGGRIANMPENPSSESYLFGGWKNNTTDEYADDAYLNIPAIGGSRVLVFSAQWNDKPDVPTYEVRFFEKDSATQIGVTQIVNEGENATPPQAPEVSGFHFVGWDKDYTTISANTDIYALYGEEGKTWIVSYMDINAEGAYQLLLRDTVEDGAKAPSVLPPLKENCTFAFWGVSADQPYSNEGEQADLNIVRSDMTVYAKYTKTKQDDEPGDNPGEDPGEESGDNTALEESADDTTNTLVQKVLVNGHLFIRRGNHIYNGIGVVIK